MRPTSKIRARRTPTLSTALLAAATEAVRAGLFAAAVAASIRLLVIADSVDMWSVTLAVLALAAVAPRDRLKRVVGIAAAAVKRDAAQR